MREYQQKHTVRTILYSRVTIVILFVLAILLLRSIMELNDKRIEVAKLHEDSRKELNDLENKVIKAEEKNREIATERGFENYVRTTYPVVKEGEGVIVVYDANKNVVSPVREDMTVWENLLIFWNRLNEKR